MHHVEKVNRINREKTTSHECISVSSTLLHLPSSIGRSKTEDPHQKINVFFIERYTRDACALSATKPHKQHANSNTTMKLTLSTHLLTTAALLLLVLPKTVVSQTTNCTVDADCLALEGFCGRDLVCHAHAGCQEWFTHGPLQYTGYEDNTTAVELSCSDYDGGEEDDANSVTFGCRPYAFAKRAPKGEILVYVCISAIFVLLYFFSSSSPLLTLMRLLLFFSPSMCNKLLHFFFLLLHVNTN